MNNPQQLFADVMAMLSNIALAGGAIWTLWGIIVLAGGLKDKNGPALQSGIWQIVGGVLIMTAAVLFKQITI